MKKKQKKKTYGGPALHLSGICSWWPWFGAVSRVGWSEWNGGGGGGEGRREGVR